MEKQKPTWSRSDYTKDNKIAHAPYYRFIAHEVGAFEYLERVLTDSQRETLRSELFGGNVHLNDIRSMPLSWWDTHAYALKQGFAVARHDNRIDEHWSLGSGVCALKGAALAILLNIEANGAKWVEK